MIDPITSTLTGQDWEQWVNCRFRRDTEGDIGKPYYRPREYAVEEIEFPSFSRNTGDILEIIAQATAEKHVSINLRLDFANDTHFCVWAYVVDLDQNTFEVLGDSETKKPPPQSLTMLVGIMTFQP